MATPLSVLVLAADVTLASELVQDIRQTGAQVWSATGLLEAALYHTACSPCVVLCDCDGLDWKEVVEVFYQLRTAVPVVFLSRAASESLRAQMIAARATDLLTKPYRREDLYRVLSQRSVY